jgi:ABC-type phosphate transport system substrate-binding protein
VPRQLSGVFELTGIGQFPYGVDALGFMVNAENVKKQLAAEQWDSKPVIIVKVL